MNSCQWGWSCKDANVCWSQQPSCSRCQPHQLNPHKGCKIKQVVLTYNSFIPFPTSVEIFISKGFFHDIYLCYGMPNHCWNVKQAVGLHHIAEEVQEYKLSQTFFSFFSIQYPTLCAFSSWSECKLSLHLVQKFWIQLNIIGELQQR